MRPPLPLASVRNRAGVALPVVLLGLMAIGVIVTGAVVSTTTESAISSVHRGSVQALYRVEEGIEAYVGTTGAADGPLDTGTFEIPTAQGPVRLTVAHLATREGTGIVDSIYSIRGRPAGPAGGRSVTAMFTRRFTLNPSISLNAFIPSGLVLGADTNIRGNADVSRGPSGKLETCTKATAQTKVTMASDATVTLNGKAKQQIGDDTTRATWNRHEMVREVLGIDSLEQLVPRADITFGVDESGATHREPSFQENRKTQSPTAGGTPASYDWGCPNGLVWCGAGAKRDWMPVIVIDAGGQTVKINQEYGQGMLIVLDGDLHMNAGYSFKGIIAVEGVVNLNGNIHIEGAVLAQGVTQGAGHFGTINGTQDIYFNRCVIEEVIGRVNEPPPGSPTPPPSSSVPEVSSTFNWFEIVR